MSLEDRPDDRRDTSGSPKKPYEPPRLVAYGNIAAVTQSVGKAGSPDGGSINFRKATQP
jgi:hypothetical protein